MSITEELRAGGKHAPVSDTRWFGEDELLAIADRIDAEHAEAVADALQLRGEPDRWVELPVDADGVPIRIGDELDVGFVARIVITDDEWTPYLYAYKETPNILSQYFCNEVSHHHAPTVEDVLREMLVQAVGYSDASTTVALNAITEFAAKLRLAKEDA